jgi:hypothetical protein
MTNAPQNPAGGASRLTTTSPQIPEPYCPPPDIEQEVRYVVFDIVSMNG